MQWLGLLKMSRNSTYLMLKIKNLKHRKLKEWLFVIPMHGIDGALCPIIYATWDKMFKMRMLLHFVPMYTVQYLFMTLLFWQHFFCSIFFIRLPQSFLIPPTVWGWRFRRRRRISTHVCLKLTRRIILIVSRSVPGIGEWQEYGWGQE